MRRADARPLEHSPVLSCRRQPAYRFSIHPTVRTFTHARLPTADQNLQQVWRYRYHRHFRWPRWPRIFELQPLQRHRRHRHQRPAIEGEDGRSSERKTRYRCHFTCQQAHYSCPSQTIYEYLMNGVRRLFMYIIHDIIILLDNNY